MERVEAGQHTGQRQCHVGEQRRQLRIVANRRRRPFPDCDSPGPAPSCPNSPRRCACCARCASPRAHCRAPAPPGIAQPRRAGSRKTCAAGVDRAARCRLCSRVRLRASTPGNTASGSVKALDKCCCMVTCLSAISSRPMPYQTLTTVNCQLNVPFSRHEALKPPSSIPKCHPRGPRGPARSRPRPKQPTDPPRSGLANRPS